MERLNLDKVKIMAAAATLAMFAGTACAMHHHEHNGVFVYGEVNEELLWTDDGQLDSTIFANNNYAPGLLGVAAATELDKCWRVGGVVEFQFNVNNTRIVSQIEETDPFTPVVYTRKLDAWVSEKCLGKLSLGLGYAASWGITNMSFSGTTETSLGQVVANTAGGMYFWNTATAKAVTGNPNVDTVFNALNGVGDWTSLNGMYPTENRVRYDSPMWWGFTAAVSYGNLNRTITNSTFATIVANPPNRRQYFDAALRFDHKLFCDFKVAAGAAYGYATQDGYNPTYVRGRNVWSGSVAAIHEPTGLNAAFAIGTKQHETSAHKDNYTMWYVQVGDRFCWTHYGKTSVAVDYMQTENSVLDSDEGQSWGVGVTQDLNKCNSAVYASVRGYNYDTDSTATQANTSWHNIFAFTVGMQYKFGAKL